MSELDNRVKQIQADYEKAVRDGYIDPNKMDIERFADVMADDIEYFDSPAKDLVQKKKRLSKRWHTYIIKALNSKKVFWKNGLVKKIKN